MWPPSSRSNLQLVVVAVGKAFPYQFDKRSDRFFLDMIEVPAIGPLVIREVVAIVIYIEIKKSHRL